jgi:hypothetical protein
MTIVKVIRKTISKINAGVICFVFSGTWGKIILQRRFNVTEINNAEKKSKKEMNTKSHIFVIVNARVLILFEAIKKCFYKIFFF